MNSSKDTLSRYGQSFQTKVISALLKDVKLVDSLYEIIHTKFFESEANKWIVENILNYYNSYKSVPSLDVFKAEIEKIDEKSIQKNIINQLKLVYTSIESTDLQYVKDEFTSFCINQNLKDVIIQSVDLLKAGNYDRIKELVDRAMKVGVETDLGTEYVLDYDDRTSDDSRETVATDWDVINELMGGGLGPGELGVVVAPSGVGKCVGADTIIDIEYDEIGIELKNGMVIWYKPWDVIQLGNGVGITASAAAKIIETSGYGKTN
jgi:replicative DNA helicase